MARKKIWELSMRKIREILRLGLKCHRSNREIARSLKISHVTVGRYLSQAKEAGLAYTAIEKVNDIALRLLFKPNDITQNKKTYPQPDWAYIHLELKKRSVTLQLLWQEYKSVHPDGYQSTQFCELYRRWEKRLNPSLYRVHKAGEKAFVDYAGHTIPIVNRHTGDAKHAEIFVAVLGASNYTYSEATWDQSMPNWIGSHTRAFEYFKGVPEVLVPDNLKSGISKACKYEPDINPTYHDMAVYYGTTVVPARVAKPRDKAKVETGVQVVERWILAALRNRTFFSLNELNQAIGELLIVLNERPFKKLEGSRRSWFEKLERQALMPLPQTSYVYAEWKKAKANIDYHIDVNGHYYSLPYKLRGEKFDVRYTSKTVEIFCNSERIASHLRDDSKGRHTTIKEHMPKSHREYLEWNPSRMISWAETIGASTAKLIETILTIRKHPEQGYRSCMGILRLAKKYSEIRLEAACKRALAIRGYSYKSVDSILKHGLDKAKVPDPEIQVTTPHENIRGSKYFIESHN